MKKGTLVQVSEHLSLQPIETQVGWQIEWSTNFGVDGQAARDRWTRFWSKHELCRKNKKQARYCVHLREANKVIKEFVLKEKFAEASRKKDA